MRQAVLIAAGGTGGHLYPAIAVGDALRRRGHSIAFAVDRRGARYLPDEAPRIRIDAVSPSGRPLRRLLALARVATTCLSLLIRFGWSRPRAVAAFGSYASVPTGLAAGMLRIPLILHEQNAVLGRAHRLLARYATHLALTFGSTALAPASLATSVVGNPVRTAFAPEPLPEDERLTLFVVGGSQGATILANVVPAALARLDSSLRGRLRVVQQCRIEDLERVETAYREAGLPCEVQSFFDDMPARISAASLVVSRSGASSVAELLAVGRPAILVAYPHAADDHQRANATAVATAGAALAIDPDDFTAGRLAAELTGLLGDPTALGKMADSARELGRPDAAERVADLIEEVMR